MGFLSQSQVEEDHGGDKEYVDSGRADRWDKLIVRGSGE